MPMSFNGVNGVNYLRPPAKAHLREVELLVFVVGDGVPQGDRASHHQT